MNAILFFFLNLTVKESNRKNSKVANTQWSATLWQSEAVVKTRSGKAGF